jgi:hypothetical protein
MTILLDRRIRIVRGIVSIFDRIGAAQNGRAVGNVLLRE